jgi:hypothetical protein
MSDFTQSTSSWKNRNTYNPTREMNGERPKMYRPCIFFAQGTCRHGSECRFIHDASEINKTNENNNNNSGNSSNNQNNMNSTTNQPPPHNPYPNHSNIMNPSPPATTIVMNGGDPQTASYSIPQQQSQQQAMPQQQPQQLQQQQQQQQLQLPQQQLQSLSNNNSQQMMTMMSNNNNGPGGNSLPPLPSHFTPSSFFLSIAPNQPIFSIDVECVATGIQHNSRSVAQVALVDEWCRPVFNAYIQQDKPVVSYLTQLTGITKDTLDRFGMPLGKKVFLLLYYYYCSYISYIFALYCILYYFITSY